MKKQLIICEVNQVNFADFCRYASGLGIKTAYWFLWLSDKEDHRKLDLYNPAANPEIGDRWIKGLAEYMGESEPTPPPEPTPPAPAPVLTLAQLAHKIYDRACRWRAEAPPQGFNPNIRTHDYIHVRPQLGMMLTDEYSMEGFRIVVCAMGVVIYDPATGKVEHTESSEPSVKLLLQRWGLPKA